MGRKVVGMSMADTPERKPRRRLTRAELLDWQKKERWWGEGRNKRRRWLYRNDPEVREKLREVGRRVYRERKGMTFVNCGENLKQLATMGRTRAVRDLEGLPRRFITFNFQELGRALNRNHQVVERYVKKGMLPAPVLEDALTRARLYALDEVRAIVRVLSKHEEKVRYYRRDHDETRDELFEAVEAVRDRHGLTD